MRIHTTVHSEKSLTLSPILVQMVHANWTHAIPCTNGLGTATHMCQPRLHSQLGNELLESLYCCHSFESTLSSTVQAAPYIASRYLHPQSSCTDLTERVYQAQHVLPEPISKHFNTH